jgi:putative spermidine/putrescine transport system ATP-binding protein
VEHGGARLTVSAAQGRQTGERVLVLVRPEILELQPAGPNGGGENGLVGDVLTHTFLGPVTRVKVIGSSADLIADIPTSRVEALPIGMRVVARVPSEGVRLLALSPEDEASPASPAADEDDH